MGAGDTFLPLVPPLDYSCDFFFATGHDRQLLLHGCMLQLMKRFGSFRGSKKRKEQYKSVERRWSDPHGLLGRDKQCFPSGCGDVGGGIG